MQKTMRNDVHLEGFLYDHKLEERVTGADSKAPGTHYIRGTIDVATDDALTNIVTVNYTYITPTTRNGKEDSRYTVLTNVLNGTYGTVMSVGADKATKVRIDSSIGVNDFYSNRSGADELVSAKRNEGGFIHVTNTLAEDEKSRNTFDVDIVITGTTRKEEDPEKELPEKLVIKGAIFSFAKALLPVEFSVLNPKAMDYFEGLGASARNPIFTRVKGNEISETIKRKIEEEGAWGEMSVREVTNTRRDFVVSWAKAEPYLWNDESTITVEEFKQAIADRETYLATVKQRYEDSKAKKNGGMPFGEETTSKTAAVDNDVFNF